MISHIHTGGLVLGYTLCGAIIEVGTSSLHVEQPEDVFDIADMCQACMDKKALIDLAEVDLEGSGDTFTTSRTGTDGSVLATDGHGNLVWK